MKHSNQKENINRKNIFYIGIAIFVLLIMVSTFLIIFALNASKKTFIQYSDNKDIEYNVTLKENEYYKENQVEKGNQYIANLINVISANFKYHFDLPTQYDYKYKVVGVTNVIDEKTNKTIYTFSEDLIAEQVGQCDGALDINQNVNIDFDKYNNLIKQFVNSYDLKNVTCTLSLDLDLGITSSTQQFEPQNFNVMSLDIPLAQNTIAIDTRYDSSNNNNLIEFGKDYIEPTPFYRTAVIIFVIDILSLIAFVVYLNKTETEEEKYDRQLKKILNNYDSYISRVDDDFNMQNYQILKVQRFLDLLEIRDTMQLPIIMLENKDQCVTCFVIPTPSNILYFYSIGLTQPALPTGENMVETREKYEQKV